MQLFKITEGPWEKLFQGSFQQHEVELYSNPDKILLVIVYEKKLDRVEGAIVELYKVFHATGDVESFVETLPREILILTKHDASATTKFMMLGSKPAYVRWTEQEFTKEVDTMIKRIGTSASMIKDVSKAYELTLKGIGEATDEVKSAFFSEPMLAPILATSSHIEPATETSMKVLTKGDIILGLTRDKKQVVEPLALFVKTIVSGGEKKNRERVLHILGESALLSNVAAAFFDFDYTYSGIGQANQNTEELRKYKVDIDPLGFPLKKFEPGESLFVDLNLINPEGTAEIFGVGDKDFPRILKYALQKERVASLGELADKVKGIPQSEEFSEFSLNKAQRILGLMDIRYPKLFGGENEIREIVRQGTSNLARASLVDIVDLDARGKLLVLHSVLLGMLRFSQQEKTKFLRAIAIIPEAQILQQGEKNTRIIKEIANLLAGFPENSLGFALGTEQLIDVQKEVVEFCTARINIVDKNDLGVQLANRKSYRVLARPTLSRQKHE